MLEAMTPANNSICLKSVSHLLMQNNKVLRPKQNISDTPSRVVRVMIQLYAITKTDDRGNRGTGNKIELGFTTHRSLRSK